MAKTKRTKVEQMKAELGEIEALLRAEKKEEKGPCWTCKFRAGCEVEGFPDLKTCPEFESSEPNIF